MYKVTIKKAFHIKLLCQSKDHAGGKRLTIKLYCTRVNRDKL